MENFNTFIQRKTKNLAIKVVNGYTQINQKEYFSSAAVVFSKQFLRCGTTAGAVRRCIATAMPYRAYWCNV